MCMYTMGIYMYVCTLFPQNYYPHKATKCSNVYMCISMCRYTMCIYVCVCELFPQNSFFNKATKCSNQKFQRRCSSMVLVYRVGFLCLSFMYWHMYIFARRWRCRKLRDSSSRARRRCSLLQIASWGTTKSFLCVRIVSVCLENSFCVYLNVHVHVYIWVFIYLYVSVSRNNYLRGKVSRRVNGVCRVERWGAGVETQKNVRGEIGDGVEYHLMSPTPRR